MDGQQKFVSSVQRFIHVGKMPELHPAAMFSDNPPLHEPPEMHTYEKDLICSEFVLYFHSSIPWIQRTAQVQELGVTCDPLFHYFSVGEFELISKAMTRFSFHNSMRQYRSAFLLAVGAVATKRRLKRSS